MKIRAIRIPTEGAPVAIELEKSDDGSTLAALQREVGGYIECVSLDESTDLWCNEESKILGLPFNEIATTITRGILASHDLVSGNCVVTGLNYDEGETTDVSDAWAHKLIGDLAKPPHGTRARVEELPTCDLCSNQHQIDVPAVYDGKTRMGPWANMCSPHFVAYGVGLGMGRGQKLVPRQKEEA